MKTSDEIRKEIEILEAEEAGLRLKILRNKDLQSECHRQLCVVLTKEDAHLPKVRVTIDMFGSQLFERVFVKKTKKRIILRNIGESFNKQFDLNGTVLYKGEQIHPEDLAKILDGTI